MKRSLRIATRRSRLALWQTRHVADLLRAQVPDLEIELIEATTTGDTVHDRPLAEIGAFGLFTKELERLILDDRADIAVHSLKDMETTLAEGLSLLAVPPRADPHDVLLTRSGVRLADLPRGSRIGTSSIRRRAQLRSHRPDLDFVTLRGNVPTRLGKLERGEDGIVATIMARAGLERLELLRESHEILPGELMLPAVGQGAIGIEGRTDDEAIRALLGAIDHPGSHAAVRAERAWLRTLHGGCQVPAGSLATVDGDTLHLDAVVCSLDGDSIHRGSDSGPARDPESVGVRLAESLLERGADEIVAAIEATLRRPSS